MGRSGLEYFVPLLRALSSVGQRHECFPQLVLFCVCRSGDLRLVVEPAETGFKIRVVGQCKHNKLSFKRKFEKLVAAFEQQLGA